MKLESWSEQHRTLVRKMPMCRGMPEEDFAVFWAQCVQSGLDPMTGQCHAVARQVKTNEPELDPKTSQPLKEQGSNGKWYTVYKRATTYQFQATEAGMLARAMRFPDCRSAMGEAVYDGDHIVIDKANGKVEHVFNPAKRVGKLVGAWGRVVRDGMIPEVVWVPREAVDQGGDFWAKMPALMLAKCGRVAAIRKAYPEAFGAVYIPEEMPPEGREEQLAQLQSPISGTRKVDAPGATAPTAPGDVAPEHKAEVEAICAEAAKLGPGTTSAMRDAYSVLHARAIALPKGSNARTVAAKAMREASERMKQPAPPATAPELEEAERAADGICADVEALEKEDSEGYQRLRARAEKLPEGAARARALASLDAVKVKLEVA